MTTPPYSLLILSANSKYIQLIRNSSLADQYRLHFVSALEQVVEALKHDIYHLILLDTSRLGVRAVDHLSYEIRRVARWQEIPQIFLLDSEQMETIDPDELLNPYLRRMMRSKGKDEMGDFMDHDDYLWL